MHASQTESEDSMMPTTPELVSDNPVPDAPQPSGSPNRRGAVLSFVEAYLLLILLIGIAVFFSLYPSTSDTFLTSANMRILVGNQVVPAIIALAALIPLICNQIDLSVGAIAGVAAVFVASVLSGGSSIPEALVIGVVIGLGIGLLNGLLVTRAGVNGVIATLGTSALLAGVVSQKTGGEAVVSNIPTAMTNFGSGNTFGVPTLAWTLLLIVVVIYFVMGHTPFGRQTYALGSNKMAAELVGLRTRMITTTTFVIAGGLSGIAGVIYVARAGGADPSVGPSLTLAGLAAAFLSAAAVQPGRFNVGGTVVAVFFLAVLNNGLDLAGAQPYVASYVNGIALIGGVAMAMALARRRTR